MRASIKAALAATTGAGLLLGGAGTLSYWSDSESGGASTVTSGHLAISAVDCGTGWSDSNGAITLSSFRIVPGDTITQSCSVTVDVAGDNLTSKVTFVKPALDGNTLAGELTYGATYRVNSGATSDLATYDNAAPALVDLADGDVVTIAYTVTLPKQAGTIDNDSNSNAEFTGSATGLSGGELQAVLSALTVTLSQT